MILSDHSGITFQLKVGVSWLPWYPMPGSCEITRLTFLHILLIPETGIYFM